MEFTSINGVLFNKNITKLINYPAGIIERIYFMPSSVTIIENRAFFGNHYLEQLIMNLNSSVNIKEKASYYFIITALMFFTFLFKFCYIIGKIINILICFRLI